MLMKILRDCLREKIFKLKENTNLSFTNLEKHFEEALIGSFLKWFRVIGENQLEW